MEPAPRLAFFERHPSLWLALCILAGIAAGKLAPAAAAVSRGVEFGQGSQINAPVAVLIRLKITPMEADQHIAGCIILAAAPGALIGAGNFFERAVATLAGVHAGAPVMLSACAACNRTRHWFSFQAAR